MTLHVHRTLAAILLSIATSLAAGCGGCGAAPPGEGEGEGEGEPVGTTDGGSNVPGEGEGEGEGDAGPPPGFPAVTITAPSDGASFGRGESIVFSCEAEDAEDGTIPNASFVWGSSLDGQLGIGATVQNALSTVGEHVVTCAVQDSDGNVGAATIGLRVVDNFAPVVTIAQPADGAFVKTGTTVTFSGSATDAEDGAIPNGSLRWLDGGAPLGVGATVSTVLQQGEHVVVLEATDSGGVKGTATITIHVVDDLPPVCTITSPQAGASFFSGQSVTFSSTCTDPEGGAVANGSITWSSDLQGPLGTGASVTNALVALGTHVIQVCAADPLQAGLQGCARVTVTVAPNQAPTTPVLTPDGPQTYAACAEVDLRCDADDPEGQVVSYVWTDSLEGQVGTGDHLQWTPSSGGARTVTCTASDPQGNTSTAQISVTVVSPVATITGPSEGQIFRPGATVSLEGEGCSAPAGPLTGAQLSWSSSRDGALGTGSPRQVSTLSRGEHQITLTAQDGVASGQDAISIWVNEPPVVTITSPSNGATVNEGVAISFAGTAVDAEDDPDPTPIWQDSAIGDFGQGPLVSFAGLPRGKHKVTLRATDLAGETSTANVSFTVLGQNGEPLVGRSSQATVPFAGIVNAVAYEAAQDDLWVATSGQGLVRLNASTLSVEAAFQVNGSLNVLDVAVLSDGRLLIGTADAGFAIFCDGRATPNVLQGCQAFGEGDLNGQLSSDRVQAVAVLQDGRTLVGTDACLVFSDWQANVHAEYCDGDGGVDGLTGENVRDVTVDAARGEVWIATNEGASRMVPSVAGVQARGDQSFFRIDTDDGLPSNDVRGTAVAPSGDVWVATALGLARAVGSGGAVAVTAFRAVDGLPSNDVRGVAVDVVTFFGTTREVAWAATAGGLARVDASIPSVVSITAADGLPTNDLRAITVGAGNVKLIGTPAGVVSYRGQ